MNLKEQKIALFEKIKDKAFVYDNIPCYVKDVKDIMPSYRRCPKCGHDIMTVRVSSPAHYWHNRCGREGLITICSHCGEQGDFSLLKMN